MEIDQAQILASVSSQTRALVASQDRLMDTLTYSVGAIRQILKEEVTTSLDQLYVSVDGVLEEVCHVSALLHWGFPRAISLLSHVNDSLQELCRLARTPSQVWAYEQYELARDAFQRDLVEEALEFIGRAIEGYGSNTGFRTDYRFHFLKGLINLKVGHEQQDRAAQLETAKESFALAARYSKNVYSLEIARALISAGWTCFLQNNFAESLRYTVTAREFGHAGSSHFQEGKIHARLGLRNEALSSLDLAIRESRTFAIEALCDTDYMAHEEAVSSLIRSLRDEEKNFVTVELLNLEEKIQRARRLGVDTYALPIIFEERFNLITDQVRSAALMASAEDLFALQDARRKVQRLTSDIDALSKEFPAAAKELIRSDLQCRESDLKSLQDLRKNKNHVRESSATGAGIGFLLGLVGCAIALEDAGLAGCSTGIGVVVMGILAGLVFGVICGSIMMSRVPENERKFQRELVSLRALQSQLERQLGAG